MALSGATTWEVRDTGSDSNGGGFVPGATGTDRSQQDAAFATLTAASVIHTTTTQINVAVGDFTVSAADVGNLLQITGGTATAGFYQITAADVVNNRWTVDRSAGTAGQTVVGAMGGALLTVGKVMGAAVSGSVSPSPGIRNHVWVKGSFTITATITIPSTTDGLLVEGYSSTRGDGGRATVTTATNSVHLFTFNSAHGGMVFRNFNFTNTAGTPASGFTQTAFNNVLDLRFTNCSFDGFTSVDLPNPGLEGRWNIWFSRCEIRNCTGQAVKLATNSNSSVSMFDTWVHDNASDGIGCTSSTNNTGSITCIMCLFTDNTGKGINMTRQSSSGGTARAYMDLYNNTFANNGSDGVSWTSLIFEGMLRLYGNIFYGNGGWGLTATANNILDLDAFANAYGSNSSGDIQNLASGVGDVTLTADPFVDSGSQDYNLNNDAGGGAACRNAGFPGTTIP